MLSAQCKMSFSYTAPSYGSTYTSGQIETVTADYPGTSCDAVYSYNYDANGNITEIYRNNILKISYTYDELGQLTRENNADSGNTTVYDYDGYGNIAGKRVYNYTTSQSLSGLSYTAVNYTYGFNTGYWSGLWGDLLKSYNGQQISYDEVGNPVEIGSDISLSWTQGRLLSSYEETDGDEVYYKYNADGIRTSKTVAGKEHRYTLNGTQVLSEEWTVGTVQHLMIYVYDAEGSPVGFRYRNSTFSESLFKNYIYGKNVQGDIIYIFNIEGDKVAEYSYDAWGNPVEEPSDSINNPGIEFSPFRYRGYWYDKETGLYYLNSRYYNPEWGRFLNADIYLNANGDILGFNMFAYCGNNPVNKQDLSGEIAITTLILIVSIVAGCLVAGHTAATSYKYTGKVDVENTILSGLGAFFTVYSFGITAYGVYLTYCDYKGYTPVTGLGSSPTISSAPTSQPHGNSAQSTKPQHGYEIYNKKTGDVVKTGISGQPLNQNGTSPRANIQVNAFNKLEGDDIYAARIVKQNMPGRAVALEWERNNTQNLWDLGNSLSKHQRPNPMGR